MYDYRQKLEEARREGHCFHNFLDFRWLTADRFAEDLADGRLGPNRDYWKPVAPTERLKAAAKRVKFVEEQLDAAVAAELLALKRLTEVREKFQVVLIEALNEETEARAVEAADAARAAAAAREAERANHTRRVPRLVPIAGSRGVKGRRGNGGLRAAGEDDFPRTGHSGGIRVVVPPRQEPPGERPTR